MLRKSLVFIFIFLLGIIPYSCINFNLNIIWINTTILIIFIILEIIKLFLLSLSFYKTIKKEVTNNYLFLLISNYLVNYLTTLFIFNFKSLLLGIFSLITIFISLYYLTKETYKINKQASYYLVHYFILEFYLLVTFLYILFF